jgi:hypothetical protein
MNSTISNLLAKMNQMMGVVESPFKSLTKKLGHEPTPQKRVRSKPDKKLTNKQKSFVERKSKKRRKMADKSRRINRLRGVG